MNILFIKLAFTATALGAIVSGQLTTLPEVQTDALNNEEEITIQEETNALEEWLFRLSRGENCPPEGIWDVHSFSYGRYCYKKGTFLGFVRLYNLMPQAEDNEVFNMMGDPKFQDILTRAVFENNPKDRVHWRNTVLGNEKLGIKGIGLPPNL